MSLAVSAGAVTTRCDQVNAQALRKAANEIGGEHQRASEHRHNHKAVHISAKRRGDFCRKHWKAPRDVLPRNNHFAWLKICLFHCALR
jgi:hypothetical protein